MRSGTSLSQFLRVFTPTLSDPCANCLIMVYICTKFNTSESAESMDGP